ncbi:hypothetical protein R50345_17835 [Paenibacillus sp. FSL R5-0345]|uniref:peptidylprolyl isomerase n=1 Tax=Paenibacillus sp. FSL R5-0345 TaxID=1536770 RepID=UPI0004F899E8|nr:peptidylprolyl isomerase [Paenibacillus sp. FSL R5-0345]AIQ36322.1 hypothetical protein R50345_17835 [Paenibacillus sp. FSL R5-0345]
MSLETIVALTVDGKSTSLNEVLRYARNRQAFSALHNKARQILFERYAHTQGVQVSVKELQEGIDDFRRKKGLLQVPAATEWLQRNRMTLDDLGECVRETLIESKLMHIVCSAQVEKYYYEQRISFDTAIISQIIMAEYGAIRELMYRIEEGGDFYTYARQYSLDDATRLAGGYTGEVTRAALSPVEAASVFGAQPGEIVGPVKTNRGYHLIKVEEMKHSVLDERRREQILALLFEEWVAEQLSLAKIEIPLWDQI